MSLGDDDAPLIKTTNTPQQQIPESINTQSIPYYTEVFAALVNIHEPNTSFFTQACIASVFPHTSWSPRYIFHPVISPSNLNSPHTQKKREQKRGCRTAK